MSKLLVSIRESSFYETLKHSKNYLSIGLANQGLRFISIPVLTYLLTTSDYGILNIYGSWISILSVLMVFNLNGAISRYFYEDKVDFKSFVGYSLLITLIAYTVTFVIVILNVEFFAVYFGLPSNVMYFLLVGVLFAIVSSVFRQVYQPLKDSARIKKYSIGSVYLTFAFTVVFILLREDKRYLGSIQATLLISAIYSFIKLKDVFKYSEFSSNVKYLPYILKFALPNLPYLLSGLILSQIDRLIINNQLGSSEAGLYSFAYNIGGLQLMFSNAIHNAWTPQYYIYRNENALIKYRRDARFYSNLISLIACSLMLFGSELGQLLSSESFHESLVFIPVIVFGMFFVGLSPFNKNEISYQKKTYINAIIVISVGVLNTILNLYFIPIYGSIAAAYTTLISYLVLFLMEYFVVKYFMKSTFYINFSDYWKSVLSVFLTMLCFYLFFSAARFSWLILLLKLFYLAGVMLFMFFNKINYKNFKLWI
jgi:O-antigen/teichoic acid export membrane protein